MKENWVKKFKSVGLELRILKEPKGWRPNPNIFQMDVGRKVQGTRRTEWFEIYPGHEDNTIQILDIDKKLNQILLLVQEPATEFEVEERKSFSSKRWAKNYVDRRIELHEMNAKFRETSTHFYITETTPSDKRHFLMGVDERQLFVAQLTKGVNSIDAARKLLGNTVKFHEGVRKMTPNRQGEWFFLKSTDEQEDNIELLLSKNKVWIEKKANIGEFAGRSSGNPHVADELVVIPQNQGLIETCKLSKCVRKDVVLSDYPTREREVYVRGKVRHIDHKTVKYTHWYQVILNNEGDTASATRTWID